MDHINVAYIGIDLMAEALHSLLSIPECSILEIFTCETDNITEFNTEIIETAQKNGIPCHIKKITVSDLIRLKNMGCQLVICAGYYYKIPVDKDLMMINIHPSFLPDGRGAWPMPVLILNNIRDGGVTLHKITEEFDSGDILIQKSFPLSAEETHKTYMEKASKVISEILPEMMHDLHTYYKNARPQGSGGYFYCPVEKDWTIKSWMSDDRIDRILRAFYGYECIWKDESGSYEIIGGRLLKDSEQIPDSEQLFPLKISGKRITARMIRQIFPDHTSEITIDRAMVIKKINQKYKIPSSAYSFASLYIWKNEMKLSILTGEDFYAVKSSENGQNTWFFPCGDEKQCKIFLDNKMAQDEFRLIYILEEQKRLLEQWYPGILCFEQDPSSDEYICDITMHKNMDGKLFRNVRNHWSKANREHSLHIEQVTSENEYLCDDILLSWKRYHIDEADTEHLQKKLFPDAEHLLIHDREALQAEIYLVYVDDIAFAVVGGYALSDNTFDLSIAKERHPVPGISYAAKHLLFEKIMDRYQYVNLEEDLGIPGIRKMKLNLVPTDMIKMYTCTRR